MFEQGSSTPTMSKPQMQTTKPNLQISPFNTTSFAREDNANFGMGFLFGLCAAIAGASIWAFITALTEYQIGWMAIGVGFITGWAVRMGGKGTSQSFGIAGACLALFGCMLGNLMTSCFFIAQQYNTGFFDVFFSLDGTIIGEIFANTFQPMDLLFYGLAIFAGYKYSRIESNPGSSKN